MLFQDDAFLWGLFTTWPGFDRMVDIRLTLNLNRNPHPNPGPHGDCSERRRNEDIFSFRVKINVPIHLHTTTYPRTFMCLLAVMWTNNHLSKLGQVVNSTGVYCGRYG